MFDFMLCTNGQIKIHKQRCRDIAKEEIESRWVVDAKNVNDAIQKTKQELFESAGGKGNYIFAPEDDPAREYAEQNFYIVNCAKGA